MQQDVKKNDSAKVFGDKDEKATNHKIASLLLNFASRSHQTQPAAPRTDFDISSNSEPEAMDLSKYRKPKLSVEKVATAKAPSSNFYSGLGLGSPFLLQNLLMQQMGPGCVGGQAGTATTATTTITTTTTIPLMAGQIVAQLNSLLFAFHGVQDKAVEINVQGQLGAIYTRLQEIVSMIQISKKREPIRSNKETPQPSQSELQKQLELVTSTKEKEEQRIGRQLEEYQRALTGSTASSFTQFPTASPLTSTVATMLRKQKPVVTEALSQENKDSAETAVIAEERTSRRPSGDKLEETPPEKRLRREEPLSPVSSPPSSSSRGGRGGKGGKGIRNRVFCGDCAGCLKNDDCGTCRYCRDKTKFGGQNRLRQKCLHRRCLLDNHRRSGGGGGGASQANGQGATQGVGQPAGQVVDPAIYSRLDLARLQQATPGDHSIFTLLGPGNSGSRVPSLPNEDGEGKEETREAREESKEREGEHSQSRSDRWKAKHEAMLKQAGEEAKAGGQQVFESTSLVITLNETTRREEGEAERLQSNGLRMKTSGSLEAVKDSGRLTRSSLKTVMAV